jgi:hypothetical protein
MEDEPIFFSVRCKNPKCPYYITTPYFTTSHERREIVAKMAAVKPFEQQCGKCGQSSAYSHHDLGIVGDTIQTPDPPAVDDKANS